MESNKFYHEEPGQKIWWVFTPEDKGLWLFSFDREKIYNLFEDYPWKLTSEENEIFDRENPYWAEFFMDRKEG